jgi:hypothetical protein
MSGDPIDEERTTFLDGIAFLTGEDPSAGAFLLVVGMTTCVFIAGFQLAFPAPISYILTALVLVIAVISFIIGAILDILDYFEAPEDVGRQAEGRDDRSADAEPEAAQPVDAAEIDMDPVDTTQEDA